MEVKSASSLGISALSRYAVDQVSVTLLSGDIEESMAGNLDGVVPNNVLVVDIQCRSTLLCHGKSAPSFLDLQPIGTLAPSV